MKQTLRPRGPHNRGNCLSAQEPSLGQDGSRSLQVLGPWQPVQGTCQPPEVLRLSLTIRGEMTSWISR